MARCRHAGCPTRLVTDQLANNEITKVPLLGPHWTHHLSRSSLQSFQHGVILGLVEINRHTPFYINRAERKTETIGSNVSLENERWCG